ncbi:MAG: response regulator, partial [Chloroflexi bacterium]|nr:response regulator [Chloroflexota bacterium]
RMPVMTGIEAARRILARRPETNVVLISMGAESEYPRLARQIGARAFISKRNLSTSTLQGAMRSGGTPAPGAFGI